MTEGTSAPSVANAVRYDPYDVAINADPYPTFRRLREEAPLYFNEEYDFYAVSRFDDVELRLRDRGTFISSRGGILELIKSGIEIPPGTVIFEDPPAHTIHRSVLSRMFTPRQVAGLEPQIRRYCAEALDPHVGTAGFDLIRELGSQMPMRVIGMLLGIPEADQSLVRDGVDARLRTEAGQPMDHSDGFASGDIFGDYVDWRVEHPSDDIMTEMLAAEFEDETGSPRRLSRDELLTYIAVVAGAGNETTSRLIGWMGKTLADHADQRREIVNDRSLVPNAVEEVLRYEPPAPHVGRFVARDVEFHGVTVPAESAILFLVGAANRDHRRFEGGDDFDIHRKAGLAPDVRVRSALLPRCRAGAARGSSRVGRVAPTVSRVGRRPRQRGAHVDLHRPRVGDASDRAPMTGPDKPSITSTEN